MHLHKVIQPQLVSKMKFFKTLDKLLTITGTIYLERKPASCQNFDEKQ